MSRSSRRKRAKARRRLLFPNSSTSLLLRLRAQRRATTRQRLLSLLSSIKKKLNRDCSSTDSCVESPYMLGNDGESKQSWVTSMPTPKIPHTHVTVEHGLTRRDTLALYPVSCRLYPYSKAAGHQALGDEIKRLSEKKYSELRFPLPVDREKLKKVLAAIVLKNDGPTTTQAESLKVVALATGTKCIGGSYLKLDGSVLQDCHAEVVVRRAFMRYLYNQLWKCLQQQEQNSILENAGGKYRLKPGISIHLYVSSTPCGDASVFGNFDYHPNRISRGMARVKIESGEGAVRIQCNSQNWEDIHGDTQRLQCNSQNGEDVHGGTQRLQTMSCSDKIARWNVLGIQGCLLSMYVEPIYFQSITIGSEVREEHFKRAVYDRVRSISKLPTEYHVNCPVLHKVRLPGVKNKKSHDLSMNWIVEEETVELVKCQNGLQHLSQAQSRLCKKAMFQYFKEVNSFYFNHYHTTGLWLLSYDMVKAKVSNYQQAKEQLFKQYTSLGGWVKKPSVVDKFMLT